MCKLPSLSLSPAATSYRRIAPFCAVAIARRAAPRLSLFCWLVSFFSHGAVTQGTDCARTDGECCCECAPTHVNNHFSNLMAFAPRVRSSLARSLSLYPLR